MNAVNIDNGTRTINCSVVVTAGTSPGAIRATRRARAPMKRPANRATPSPSSETAPIVPRGTFRRRLVMRRGLLLLNTPISLARVSALVVATAPI